MLAVSRALLRVAAAALPRAVAAPVATAASGPGRHRCMATSAAPVPGPLSYNLHGKVCIVTGGGSGIGRAVAMGLAQCGGTVVVAGRRQAALDETVEQIIAGGDGGTGDGPATGAAAGAAAAAAAGGRGGSAAAQLLAVATDVTDEASVENLFAQAVAKFGRVDVVFNNAGVGAPPVPLEDLDAATWRRVVDINLTGVFLCTRAAFRVMKAQRPRGGRIINNGSVSAVSPRPLSCAYTATKHAVTGLTKSTSLDGRKHDIACGQIDIGNAETDMTQGAKIGLMQATIDGSERLAVEPLFDVRDVARTVCLMAALPPEANMQFATIMATKMPCFARG